MPDHPTENSFGDEKPQLQYKFKVSREKYLEIIGFTAYAYITGKITKFSGIMGGARALGEYIENFIHGKIAEEAFKEFLKVNFQKTVLADHDLADFIFGDYLPDVVAEEAEGRWEPMKFWIDVKEVRRGQKWLLVPPPRGKQPRYYDAYVAVWVGLPEEHLAWIISSVPQVTEKLGSDWLKFSKELADYTQDIPCEVKGFFLWSDAEKIMRGSEKDSENLNTKFGSRNWCFYDGNTKLYDPDNPEWVGSEVGENMGVLLRSLENSSDWHHFFELLKKNERIIPEVPLTYKAKSGKEISRPVPDMCKKFKSSGDYRSVFRMCMETQIRQIEKRRGRLARQRSWFEESLKDLQSKPRQSGLEDWS